MPAVLAAPLLARLFQGQLTTAAYAVAGGLAIVITLVHLQTKPFDSRYGFGHPWQLTQIESLKTNSRIEVANGIEAFDRAVPKHACVGAVLDVWEPSYLLYGPDLTRRVVYLPAADALTAAYREGCRAS